MWDFLAHNAKWVAAWITARGMSTVSFLAAAGFGLISERPINALLTALPIGMTVSTFMRFGEEKYQKRRMRNAYVYEVAAAFGEDPKSVTIQDLERVAKGNQRLGIPENSVLQEQLDKVKSQRNISLISMVASVTLATGAALLGLFADPAAALQSLLDTGFDNLTVDDMITERIGIERFNTQIMALGGIAGTISFVADHAISYVMERAFGVRDKTTYDRIQDLKSALGNEGRLEPEQVMGLFVVHDKALQADVMRLYGQEYEYLPQTAKKDFVEMMEGKYHVLELTEKINEGRIRVNELAFAVDGRHSGVPESDPSQQKPFRNVFLEKFQKFLPEHAQGQQRDLSPTQIIARPVPAPVALLPSYENPVSKLSHVERYLQSKQAPVRTQSFVERLENEGKDPTVVR